MPEYTDGLAPFDQAAPEPQGQYSGFLQQLFGGQLRSARDTGADAAKKLAVGDPNATVRLPVDDAGNVDHDEALIGGANELGTILMGGGTSFATKGALGVFGGKMAVTADRAALARAEEMAKAKGFYDADAGKYVLPKSREDIWKETGWFQGTDGKWRFEIPDNRSVFSEGAHRQVRPMGDVLDHPELYAAYPDIAKIKTEQWSASNTGYHVDPASLTRPATEKIRVPTGDFIWPGSGRGTTLHEVQHAIQSREGFAPGGDPDALMDVVRREVVKNPALAGKEQELAYEAYRRLAGEVEARNVATRANVSTEHVAPWATEDVAPAQQTVIPTRGRSATLGEILGGDKQ